MEAQPLEAAGGAGGDPDAGQLLEQYAWVVPGDGACGHLLDVDRDASGSTDDDRRLVSHLFEIDDLTPETAYRVCLATYDGVQGSFFATRDVVTLPEPTRAMLSLAVLITLALSRALQISERRGVFTPLGECRR